MNEFKMICPCCEHKTILDEYDICPVCFWEYDKSQSERPYSTGGANSVSLNEAKANYARYGACEKRFQDKVRQPLPEEE